VIAHRGAAIAVRAGAALEPAVDGADFVVTQIRVGGMAARHRDESIPLKYGVIGQETTGPGGLSLAWRTIPAMLAIARTVERRAPAAFILNYTNPSGIVTEAVRTATGARCLGLCSGIPGIQDRIAVVLADRWPRLRSYCVGLNHLGFIHRFRQDGQEVTADVLAPLYENACAHGGLANPELFQLLQAVPISYVNYYYRRAQCVAEAKARTQTRAEEIRGIEAAILREAADPACVTKPAALARRGGGGYASITCRFLQAIVGDRGDELACTVLNDGAVDGLPADAGVEVVCRVGARGATPLPVGPVPANFRALVQAVKTTESLAVRAALERSRTLALQAMVSHPLVGDLDVARPLLDELLAAHQLEFH
jgi:6-phospho-beta-glucosidase